MTMMCADCRNDLDHCHGTLVVHREGFLECTVFGCTGYDRGRHELVSDCQLIDSGCDCHEQVTAALPRAS